MSATQRLHPNFCSPAHSNTLKPREHITWSITGSQSELNLVTFTLRFVHVHSNPISARASAIFGALLQPEIIFSIYNHNGGWLRSKMPEVSANSFQPYRRGKSVIVRHNQISSSLLASYARASAFFSSFVPQSSVLRELSLEFLHSVLLLGLLL